MERFQVYGGPDVFGPWEIVASHIGRAGYTIQVTPIGDTVVVGVVRYFGEGDSRPRTESFSEQVSIQTGDSVANVDVRLKGVPTGSSCWVDVSP
jgi:hypothetical protein